VDRGDLNHGAAGRYDPVEALAEGAVGNRARVGVARADGGEGFEVLAEERDVEGRPEGSEAELVDFYPGFEEFPGGAENDYARVDEFFALHAGDDSDDREIVGAQSGARLGHGSPPP
jgi:hypothetical protein